MGRGRKGSGVQARAGDYRIRFTWNGKRYEEPYALKPSAPHGRAVERIARDLKAEIDGGTFDWKRFAYYFPDSKHIARGPELAEPTFADACATWRKTRGAELAAWTRKKDELYVRFWTEKIGAGTKMRTLLPSTVEGIVGSHPWPSAKHRNNLLSALRGIFALWCADDPARRDPTARITNATVQLPPPDPFDLEEAELILADMRKHYDPRVVAYFQFAFYAGARPEEEIALRWTKLDARKKVARIDVARTAHGDEKPTKTHVARDIDLNSKAWEAIEAMRPYTALKGEDAHVFENPRTGKPWASEADQRDLYWRPTLKRLRIRYRVPYQTRATRATAMLMAGMNPAYCARQLGHSKRVFFERYATWIERADSANARERAKDEAAITTPSRESGGKAG